MFNLYDYYRSSTCFRVRIALNLKEQAYTLKTIHLIKGGGEQLQEPYRTLNPQALVPCLEDTNTQMVFTQSLAIIEYLEEIYPTPPLLPQDPTLKAKIRAFSQMIACEMHPLNNLRVLKYLTDTLQVSDKQKWEWYHHWLALGFHAIEENLAHQETGPYCFGKTPTIADICLVPQVYNAQRFEFSLTPYPLTQKVAMHCLQHPAFINALPENHPEAPAS